VKDRAEAKRLHAVLTAELKAAATVLSTSAQALNYPDREDIRTADPVEVLNRHADLLEPSKLGRLIREHAAVSKRIEEMDQHARGMGID
jgi:hypothetical protein